METGATDRRLRALFAPSQVNAKTVVWTLGTTLLFVAAIWLLWKAPLALGVSFIAAVLAIALEHPVNWLMRHRWKRGWAITVVMLGLFVLMAGILVLAVPPLVNQLTSFVEHLPDIINRFEQSDTYHRLNAYLHLQARFEAWRAHPPAAMGGLANHALRLLGSAFEIFGGLIAIIFVTLFMLIYGPGLVRRTVREARRRRRPYYERVLENIYHSLGGYITGLFILCITHAVAITIFLAVIGVPFFLPLGLLAGFSSLIPIVGATIAGITLTLVAFIAGGTWQGFATLGFYLLYQQIENHVLAPIVYRRTVELNPLLCLLIFLFFTELFGLEGGVIAVPVLAMAQIIIGELLHLRQRWFLEEKPEDAPESVQDVEKTAGTLPSPPPEKPLH